MGLCPAPFQILLANSAKLFRALEGRPILAGGGAQRSHRNRPKGIFRVPAGTLDKNSRQKQSESGALSDSAGEFRIGEFLQHCSHKEVGQFFKLSR
jgi:hypothetical protein